MLELLARRPVLTANRVYAGQFSLTKQLGAPIDFLWPCTNSGNADGVAFIAVTEGGNPLWISPAFTIPAGLTVGTNLHQTLTQALGLHSLAAELREGAPPDGIRLIMSDTVALTIVSNPVLAPVGLPTVNGVVGPALVTVLRDQVVPVSWPCQNTGGGSGQARLRADSSPLLLGYPIIGSLVTIPGGGNVTLLLGLPPVGFVGIPITITLTMQDDSAVVLGTFQFVETGT